MPNNLHWSASMLLRWVLTRDIEGVLSIADDYGVLIVEGTAAERVRPLTWDGVLRKFVRDDLLPEDERAVEAVRRAEVFVIPAREWIYEVLRGGKIKSWARPNGSGDIQQIAPFQWAGLRLRSWEGHDIAIPVDSESRPLNLPKPYTDYLSGVVPVSLSPTVWPDPVFSSEQAINFWPRCDAPFKSSDTRVDFQDPSPEEKTQAIKNISPRLVSVVELAISELGWPGRGKVRWKVFSKHVNSVSENLEKRSYSDRQIRRAFNAIKTQDALTRNSGIKPC
jgi:hypothetical protein